MLSRFLRPFRRNRYSSFHLTDEEVATLIKAMSDPPTDLTEQETKLLLATHALTDEELTTLIRMAEAESARV